MLKNNIQIVWFKRDLRITDHRPLFEASLNSIPTLPIYIVETDYWKQPFSSKRHWSFIHDSLKELRKDLKNIGCLLYTSPSPRDRTRSRMPSSA